MSKRHHDGTDSIDWERVRRLFGHPRPPVTVWERQFDYCDDQLRRLARTPYEQIESSDLWYYFHDLAYVELQQELFDYLFPVCLRDWHRTLMANEACSHGDSEFHYSLHRGKALEKMMDQDRRDAIYLLFRDSFVERLNAERGFVTSGSKTPAYGWIHRFNSLGLIMPRIDMIWKTWWSLDTPGQAVAAIQYCSDLMYFEGENPLFPPWNREQGGGGPYIWANDAMIHDIGWMGCNLDFLRTNLTVAFVNDGIRKAVARLQCEPEFETAKRIENDLDKYQDLIALRIEELPILLSVPQGIHGWSI